MAPPDDIMRTSPTMSESGELSAGSVVFALPHLREAIFDFHKDVVSVQRQRKLDEIPRPMSDHIWKDLSKEVDAYWSWGYVRNFRDYLHNRNDKMKRTTGLFDIVDALGLQEADWIDYVLARPFDACAWLVAFSHYRRSCSMKLEAHPQSPQGSGNAFEHPLANPWEMILYGILGNSYGRNDGMGDGTIGKSFPILLRDGHGQTYFLRMDYTKRSPFLLEASRRCPDVLYTDRSPLYPTYEVLTYSQTHEATISIGQTPPWPLSKALASSPGHEEELRRFLECARDLFAHLVTLQRHSISLDVQVLSRDWTYSLMRAEGGPWVLPAYLTRSRPGNGTAKLSRTGNWEERLPPMPARAWPMTPLQSRTSRNALPWSQTAAYMDPRVEGPRVYLHGIRNASWSDEDAAKRREGWQNSSHLSLLHRVTPRGRYHADLLAVTQHIFGRFTSSCWVSGEELPKLLTAQALPAAYEAWYTLPLDCLPRAAIDQQHSGLFTACLKCCLAGQVSIPPSSADGAKKLAEAKCPACGSRRLISAIPASLQHLLHRIACPAQLKDGSIEILTASEASDAINAIFEAEIIRMENLYRRWADEQQEVTRLTSPAEARLPHILRDNSLHRWLMLEMLRGNYLDETFDREELNQMRDFIKNDLTPLQKQKRDEFRLACGDVVEEEQEAAVAEEDVEGAVGAKQPLKRGRRSAAAAFSTTAVGSNDAAEEAESSSSGAKKGAKRSGRGSSKGSATKKAKKKK